MHYFLLPEKDKYLQTMCSQDMLYGAVSQDKHCTGHQTYLLSCTGYLPATYREPDREAQTARFARGAILPQSFPLTTPLTSNSLPPPLLLLLCFGSVFP